MNKTKSTPTKHTPGPWRAMKDVNNIRGRNEIIGPNGEQVALTVLRNLQNAAANADRIVACVNACAGIADPSAVPEMLAALEDARRLLVIAWGRNDTPTRVCPTLDAIDAAIAKAEGRS